MTGIGEKFLSGMTGLAEVGGPAWSVFFRPCGWRLPALLSGRTVEKVGSCVAPGPGFLTRAAVGWKAQQ